MAVANCVPTRHAHELLSDRSAPYRPSSLPSGSLRAECGFEPAQEIVLLADRKPAVSMSEDVTARRHVAPSESFHGVHRLLLLPPVPLGKVQRPSAFIHISLNSPRDGRDVSVPGPDSLVAVAVEAHPSRQAPRPGTVPGWLEPNRGIRVISTVGYCLNQHQQGEGNADDQLPHTASPAIAGASILPKAVTYRISDFRQRKPNGRGTTSPHLRSARLVAKLGAAGPWLRDGVVDAASYRNAHQTPGLGALHPPAAKVVAAAAHPSRLRARRDCHRRIETPARPLRPRGIARRPF